MLPLRTIHPKDLIGRPAFPRILTTTLAPWGATFLCFLNQLSGLSQELQPGSAHGASLGLGPHLCNREDLGRSFSCTTRRAATPRPLARAGPCAAVQAQRQVPGEEPVGQMQPMRGLGDPNGARLLFPHQYLRRGWQGAVLACRGGAVPKLSPARSLQRIQRQRIAIYFRAKCSLRSYLQHLCLKAPSSNNALYFSFSTFQRNGMT